MISAPTQEPGDNSNRPATTRYVDRRGMLGAVTMGCLYSYTFDGTSYGHTNNGPGNIVYNVFLSAGAQRISMGVWIKATSLPTTGNAQVIWIPSTAGSRFYFGITNLVGTPIVYVSARTDSSNYTNYYGTTALTTAWTMLLITYDGTVTDGTNRVRIYINGKLDVISSTSVVGAGVSTFAFDSATDWYLGGISGYYFIGNLTELCMWNDVITAPGALDLYNNGSPINPTRASGSYVQHNNLVANYNATIHNVSTVTPFDAMNNVSLTSTNIGISTDVP